MRLPQFVSIAVVLFSLAGFSQNARISIPAGTAEDKELSAIAAEPDASKRMAAYEDFINKYSSNKEAAAYAEWQLSQLYLAAGDKNNALNWGDKALQDYPNDLDLIVSDTSVAMAVKNNAKTVEYAVKGAAVYHATPPQQQSGLKANYDFLETAAYNAIVAEQDPNQRMDFIEQFTPAFPKSQFAPQVTQLAMYSLQQINQPERLRAYGEKTLAADPDNIPALLMMANSYAGEAKEAAKAVEYADKVLKLVANNLTDNTQKSYAGLAHTAIGRADLARGRGETGLAELKTAVTLLQGDPADQQAALYYLGYAAAKVNRKAESIAALEKAAAIDGPYRAPAREMLSKIRHAGKD
jgi:tetratricopeptide (TPR) repeat protein